MSQLQRFVEFVEKRSQSDTLIHTLSSSFISSLPASLPEKLTADLLRNWVIRMVARGLSKTTYTRYVRRLHTLYKEFRRNHGRDPFEEIHPLLSIDTSDSRERYRHLLSKVGNLLAIIPAKKHDKDNGVVIAALAFLVYLPNLTIENLIALKYRDPIPDVAQLRDVIDNMHTAGSNRQYILPVSQGKQRTPHIAAGILKSISELLNTEVTREDLTAIWIEAALKLHIDPAEIRTLITLLPEAYSYLDHLSPVNITERRYTQILTSVADSINQRARRWHILHLRPGVKADELRQAIITALPRLSRDIDYYYPTRRVMVIDSKSKKKIKKEVPLLRNILFIKIESQKIGKMTARVGQLAWCYRQTPTPNSPYSVISHRDMQRFQHHISLLEPGNEITLRENGMQPGTQVQIEGGERMVGYIGEIESVKNTDGTRTYTLRLSAGTTATWTIADIPEAYLNPLHT